MRNSLFPTRSQVRVTSYGPYRGLRGTIQTVDTVADDQEDPFCFYLIALEGVTIENPIWFEYHEIEFIGFPLVALQPRQNS